MRFYSYKLLAGILILLLYSGIYGYFFILYEIHTGLYYEITDIHKVTEIYNSIVISLCGDRDLVNSFLKLFPETEFQIYAKNIDDMQLRIVIIPKNVFNYYHITYNFFFTEHYPYYKDNVKNTLFIENLNKLMDTLFPMSEYLSSNPPEKYLDYQPRIRFCARRLVSVALSRYYSYMQVEPCVDFEVSWDLYLFVKHSWFYLKFLYLKRLYIYFSMTEDILNWIA